MESSRKALDDDGGEGDDGGTGRRLMATATVAAKDGGEGGDGGDGVGWCQQWRPRRRWFRDARYNMGFCPNGPGCQYMHVKKPGPPPPVEEVVKKLQQMNSLYYGSSSGIYQPSDNNNNQHEKPPVQHGSVLKNQNLVAHATPIMQQRAAHHVQTAHPQHVPSPHIQQQQQQHAQVQGVPDGSSNQATITASLLPQGQSRYSIVKSCNRENMEKSVPQGVWASKKGVMMSF